MILQNFAVVFGQGTIRARVRVTMNRLFFHNPTEKHIGDVLLCILNLLYLTGVWTKHEFCFTVQDFRYRANLSLYCLN
jgi:hypothetical protein